MDISALDDRSRQEKGAFCHLKHPITEDLLWEVNPGDIEYPEGKPIGVYVRGMEAKSSQKLANRMSRRTMSGGKLKTTKDDEEAGLDYLCHLIVGFRNLSDGDRPLTDSREDKELFLGLSESFGEQVLEFAKERTNFS